MSSYRIFQAKEVFKRLWLALVVVLVASSSLPAQSQQAQDVGSTIRIVVVSGEGAEHRTGQSSVRMPLIRVETQNNQPVNEAEVLFLLPDGGPGGAFLDGTKSAKARTNPQGMAAVRPFKLNKTQGEFEIRVEASCQGQRAAGAIRQINQGRRGLGKKIAIISAVVAGGVGIAAVASKGKDGAPCRTPAPR